MTLRLGPNCARRLERHPKLRHGEEGQQLHLFTPALSDMFDERLVNVAREHGMHVTVTKPRLPALSAKLMAAQKIGGAAKVASLGKRAVKEW